MQILIVVACRRFCASLPYTKRQHHAKRYVPQGDKKLYQKQEMRLWAALPMM